MKLSHVLWDVKTEKIYGDINKDIRGITYDSRAVKENYIFVCVEGLKEDGHKFINKAIENGCNVIVIQKDIDDLDKLIREGITIIKVNDSRLALSKLSYNFYDDPSTKFKVIGVTGTNGKTSITYIINNILEANGIKAGLIGTINSQISGNIIKISSKTTPEAPDLNELFQVMLDNDVRVCAMEVSSHALDLNRVKDVKFHIGIFTNLTPDHLDFHKDMENYKEAKKKLFYMTNGANIINIDDKYGMEIFEEVKSLDTPVITYGINCNCDVYAKNIVLENDYSEFVIVTPKFEIPVRLRTPGLFAIYNTLAAVSACYFLGLNSQQIEKGIKNIKPVPGRFELVKNDKGINAIVDYAHTPDALENVLNTIKQFAKKKIIVIFGCGGDRDRTKRPVMGNIVSRLSDYFIITNDNPRTEDPQRIINDILEGIDKSASNYEIILDRREAIKRGVSLAGEGDFLLIAGKGHETYQIIGSETFHFDDREVVREFLREDLK